MWEELYLKPCNTGRAEAPGDRHPSSPDPAPEASGERISEAARFALSDHQLQKLRFDRGSTAVGGSPEYLKAFMTSEHKRCGDLVRVAGAVYEHQPEKHDPLSI